MTGASNDLHSARTRSQAALRRVSTSTTHTNSSLTNVFQDTLRPHLARCRKWKPCCDKFSAASYVNDRKTSSIHSYFFCDPRLSCKAQMDTKLQQLQSVFLLSLPQCIIVNISLCWQISDSWTCHTAM